VEGLTWATVGAVECEATKTHGVSIMVQITIDADVAAKLRAHVTEVELCDPSGRIIGRFYPKIDLSDWEPVTPDISEEELAAREKSTDWLSTEEVLAHLKSLEKQ
jgi:hypothetical protein